MIRLLLHWLDTFRTYPSMHVHPVTIEGQYRMAPGQMADMVLMERCEKCRWSRVIS